MDIFESPAVDVDEATVVNDIELDESGSAAPAVAAGVGVAGAIADDVRVDAPHMTLAGVLRTLFCVLCWFMLAAAVVYLGVAGMNYALIGAAQIPEELRGTKDFAYLFGGASGAVRRCRRDGPCGHRAHG